MSQDVQFDSFRQFWPFYVREHLRAGTRMMHVVGSTVVLVSVALAILTGHRLWFAAGPVGGYGCAWIGHFWIEKNRPATFKYPVYSFLADWVMYGKILTGTMGAEIAAATGARCGEIFCALRSNFYGISPMTIGWQGGEEGSIGVGPS